MNLTDNVNTRWMSIFVNELARNGLEAVCIAPGSRSTPLTLAFAVNPAIRLYRHLDERSAGFFALGLAKATGKPVALVCTSGTAAANFHPAVIEAYYSHVPLLVLTADRPAELRGSGANQTIDQIKMFGDHVRWAVDAPTPQDSAPDVVTRHLKTLAARACATADGLVKGPIHLNFPFRKPLEPDADRQSEQFERKDAHLQEARAYARVSRGRLLPTDAQVAWITDTIAANPRGLIICGPECPGDSFPAAVVGLAERAGYPILADPLSNLRHTPGVCSDLVLGGYHLWLPTLDETLVKPDVVLRFGVVPTSNALAAYLEKAAPLYHLHIREDGEWADDLHLTHDVVQVDADALCHAVSAQLPERSRDLRSEWLECFLSAEHKTWAAEGEALAREPFFDGAAVALLLEALPEDTILFVGNSLPVRHVEVFDHPDSRRLALFGNRGASGIDGNVSTALGLAAADGRPVVALLGDITFYHDMNGLLAVRQHQLNNVTFVVINNDGGGIFHRLPVARHDPPFTELFLTPHGLTFEAAAAMYGLRYTTVSDAAGLRQALADAWQQSAASTLIEITTDGRADYAHMRAVANAVQAALNQTERPTVA